MAERLEITMLTEGLKSNVVSVLKESAKTLPDFHFADLRLEIGQGKGAVAENMALRGAGDDYGMSVGVRVIAGHNGILAPGYDGRPVGAAEFEDILDIIKNMLVTAYTRARASAAEKVKTRKLFPILGQTLWSAQFHYPLWPKEPITIEADYVIDSINYPLEKLKILTQDVALSLKDREIGYSAVIAFTQISREFYANSLGVSIEQNFALSQAVIYAASGDVLMHDVLGHQRGPEIFTEGINEPYIQFPSLLDFSRIIKSDAIALAKAPVAPTTDGEVVVVSNPHYNALLVHEIVGHPTELDRGLKMETAYAGRTWLLKDLTDTMVGKRIGSPLLNAYSDPLLPGYGHYSYDHEGVPAKRVEHIINGMFMGFMNSLQTSTIFGGEPNGHWEATDASLVPLIRMSTTVFAAGNDNPQDLIRDVDDGYYLEGHNIPSIAESRENFRISAQKVWKIEGGERTELYRKGGMSTDSLNYFMNVSGVGTDFRLFPITNCGKGQPMQSKKLGNGGPTIRSRARIMGGI